MQPCSSVSGPDLSVGISVLVFRVRQSRTVGAFGLLDPGNEVSRRFETSINQSIITFHQTCTIGTSLTVTGLSVPRVSGFGTEIQKSVQLLNSI